MNYICRVLDYMAWFWFMEWLILVYIINRIIHGRLGIWNSSSRVHVRYRCEHSTINSISPRDHILFSIYSGSHRVPNVNLFDYSLFSLTWPASMQIYWKKESVYIRKEFNSHRTGLGHKHGCRFIVLGHHLIWPPCKAHNNRNTSAFEG